MEENKEQKSALKNVGDKLKKGAKNQAKNAVKKVLKKVLAVLAPILLKLLIVVVIIVVILQILSWLVQWLQSDDSKEAEQEAVIYEYTPIGVEEDDDDGGKTTEQDKTPTGYKISVKPDLGQQGYTLNYQFLDEGGTEIAQDTVIQQTKDKLITIDLDPSVFTDSELKIIAALEQRGVDIEPYTEDELKCFALFAKADIAGQNFDLRDSSHIGELLDLEDIRKSDTVYGTLRIKKVYGTESRSIRRWLFAICRLCYFLRYG